MTPIARTFTYRVPGTPDRHGNLLGLDVEYNFCNGAVEIETMTINGCDVFGIFEDRQEDIEAHILARLQPE